ncbi:MAG: 3-deoxy-D-manno-octulosonic acid transferase [Planctomycetes bacterium]|nr:3-deoxy-D-manno-octulosonic acid transferase [Planctomycetota bacterium]MCB9904280.1 3-deoxy-D-manno-octulosonic acid transferase [Planctomycetota bacterium]
MTAAAPADTPPPILRDPVPGIGRFALHVVYDLALWFGVLVAAPWWIVRVIADPVFRRMVTERLGFGLPAAPPERRDRRVVVHGVSVGEVKAASSIVARLRAERPDLEVVISTTTATGAEVARRTYPDLQVVRFPFDFAFVVRRFLRRVAPAAVVLIELEVWPNFLRAANRSGVPIAVANGRITERSFPRYLRFRKLMPQFQRISLFCVQDEVYARRFEELSGGSDRILVTGNVKADSLHLGRLPVQEELTRHLGGVPGQPVFVVGSTHEPEERLVTEAWRAHAPHCRLILVPRHPERVAAICRELSELGASAQRLTFLREGIERADPQRPAIVDTIGELENVYSLADLVFVGGSLVPLGGHNMLEPAAQGLPVFYGPHTENFPHEAALLERTGASRRLADSADFGPTLAELLADDAARERMARAGLDAVRTQQGATARTVRALQERCLPVMGS